MSENNENGEKEYKELNGWSKIKTGDRYTAVLDGKSVKFEVGEKYAYAGTNKMNENRGTSYYFFKTVKDTLILFIGKWSKYQGEISSYDLKKFDNKEGLEKYLDDENSIHRELMKKTGILEEIAEEV